MEKISQYIVDFICRNMTIDDDEMIDVYKYGIEITLSSVINLLMIIAGGLLLGDLPAGLIFMFCFIFLRSYTGGYHAEKYWRCNVAFICTFFAAFFLGKMFECLKISLLILIMILFAAYYPVWKYAPVKNRHKVLTEEKRKRSRKISSIVYITSVFLVSVLIYFDIWYGYMLAATDLAVSVLILLEVFMQKKGFHLSGD